MISPLAPLPIPILLQTAPAEALFLLSGLSIGGLFEELEGSETSTVSESIGIPVIVVSGVSAGVLIAVSTDVGGFESRVELSIGMMVRGEKKGGGGGSNQQRDYSARSGTSANWCLATKSMAFFKPVALRL